MNKAKEKAIRFLRKNKCTPTDTEAVWYLPFIEESIDIAMKELWEEIKRNAIKLPRGSFKILEQDIDRYNSYFTEKVEK